MNEDQILKNASICAQHMEDVLQKKAKHRDVGYLFQLGCWSIPSLIANFIDKIIKNSSFEKKVELADEINATVRKLLHAKEKIRESNPTTPH